MRVLVCDDHPFLRAGVRHAILGAVRGAVIREAATVEEGVRQASQDSFDAAIVDLALPDGCGTKVIAALRKARSETAVIVLTGLPVDEAVELTREYRVMATLPKEASTEAILRLLEGAWGGAHQSVPGLMAELSGREQQVLRGLVAGWSNRGIAERLGVSAETVKGHVATVLSKLGVSNRTEAAVLAAHHGLAAFGSDDS